MDSFFSLFGLVVYPNWTHFVLAVLLDLLVGDPHWMPHPVRWIGRLIEIQDQCFIRVVPRRLLRLAGFATVMITLTVSVGACILVLRFLEGTFHFALMVYLIFSLLALASLDKETTGVILALEEQDLESARQHLAQVVSRDTESLNEEEIIRAVIETVAENVSDAVIAPVFYLTLAGVPGMVAYKAINTLDSMIGYKSDRYKEFGWAAARLDDLANYLPARLSALLLILIAPVLSLNFRAGWRVVWRDARNQPSPNAGYPEAAVAGILGVRLGGPSKYSGKSVGKAFIGEPLLELSRERHRRVRGILYLSGTVFYVLTALTLFCLEGHA